MAVSSTTKQALAAIAATAAIAAFVAVAVDSEGSYFPTAWPLLGAGLTLAAGALVLAGATAPRRLLAAAALFLGFGLLAVLSVSWGGLPDAAWTWLDQMLIAALALVVGALVATVAGAHGRAATLAGVVAGLTVESGYMLARLAAGGAPSSWFDGREVTGPVQYHNAQAAAAAIGIPLALWASTAARVPVRASAGAVVAVLGAAVLVTQSRGAVLAVAAAVAVQVVLARHLRLAAHSVLTAAALGILVFPLRSVDAALVDTPGGDASSFRSYALWTLVVAVALAALFSVPATRRATAAVAGLAAAAVLAGAGTAAVQASDISHAVRRAFDGAKPSDLPPGQTRLSSLSLTGRRQIWSIAIDAYTRRPVAGGGIGSFTEYFTRERTNKDLYVLQPHSVELEALAELGPIGLATFLGGFALIGLAVARGGAARPFKAAAAGAVLVLLVQASFDWTFSFPSLVVPAFLVAGAAAAGSRRAPGGGAAARRVTVAALAASVLVALAAFGGPYLSAHYLSAATAPDTSTGRAWTLLRHARAFDPWNPDVLAEQAQVAENAGSYSLAAELYGRAAARSRNAWADEYRRARALREGGRVPESAAACRLARHLNPLEPLLDHGACEDVP